MLAAMLGEQEVIVIEVKPLDLHGFTCCDVTVGFPDRTWSRPPRSGGVPIDFGAGRRSWPPRAANMIVSLRRP